MAWVPHHLQGSKNDDEKWPCFWPPLRARTVRARRCLHKLVFFVIPVSGLFFDALCSFETGVCMDPLSGVRILSPYE